MVIELQDDFIVKDGEVGADGGAGAGAVGVDDWGDAVAVDIVVGHHRAGAGKEIDFVVMFPDGIFALMSAGVAGDGVSGTVRERTPRASTGATRRE